MLKWLLRLLKLCKLFRSRMALNCTCFFSFLIFWVCPVFPYWCRGLIFGATCRAILQCFRASWVCLCYPVFHVLMLPNAWFLCVYLMLSPPLTEMSTGNIKIMLLGSRARPVRGADNLNTICETTV
jgi:hypothetical protein